MYHYRDSISDIRRAQKVELSFNCRPACFARESVDSHDINSMFIEFQFELRDRSGESFGIIPHLTEVHKITVVSSK